MLILPVLPPTIVPLFVTDRAGSAPTPVGSLPVALTAKLPEPVALMLETGPSTETYWPVTLKSALPVFLITPPALTPTVPVMDVVPAVTPEPLVKVAPVPFTDTFHPAVTVLETSAPFTVMFWPAVVVPVVAAVLGVKPVVLPAIVIFPLGASSKPLTKTVAASIARMPLKVFC